MTFPPSRRTVLKGLLNGTTVAVGLPLLDIFLDGNGQAMADTGAPLPTRFGVWFWGLGVNGKRWVPDRTGANYDLKVELAPIKPFQSKVNVFSSFAIPLDGHPNFPHNSGGAAIRTGMAMTSQGSFSGPTFDVLIGDAIGTRTRFRSLDVTTVGDPRNTLSGRGNGNMNPSEGSPVALYQRVFVDGFKDPNSATFTPDPLAMARRSVLSVVEEQRKDFEATLGASDKQLLDQYFTSLRQIEKQIDIELTKPQPLESCKIPGKPKEVPVNAQIENVLINHKLMTNLLVMAMACDQARVFNMYFTNNFSSLTRAGSTTSHHQLTHEEQLDAKLGYQPNVTFFIEKIMEGWADFLTALDAQKEGDGTLLDHSLVFAHSETDFAKFHTIDSIPMMTAGNANGRVKGGMHINGKGTPVSRLGLTLQQIMGVSVDKWGTGSMQTNKPISEIMA